MEIKIETQAFRIVYGLCLFYQIHLVTRMSAGIVFNVASETRQFGVLSKMDHTQT